MDMNRDTHQIDESAVYEYICENYYKYNDGLLSDRFLRKYEGNVIKALCDSLSERPEKEELVKWIRDGYGWCFLHDFWPDHLKKDCFVNFKRNESLEKLLGKFYMTIENDDVVESMGRNEDSQHDKYREELIERFATQSCYVQLRIIRTLLYGDEDYRMWCYHTIQNGFWDDVLIPDVEAAWERHKEKQCASTIASLFPIDYVRTHQKELGAACYYSVCERLASDDGFIIDRVRLDNSYEYYCPKYVKDLCYFRIMAANHLRLNEKDAFYGLFGYIKECLQKPSYCQCHDEELLSYYIVNKNKETFRPSFYHFPQVGVFIQLLGITGNTETIMLFHKWERMLQSNMSRYLAEEEAQSFGIDDFIDYLDWNWEVFQKHALLTFPNYDASKNDNAKTDESPLLEGEC